MKDLQRLADIYNKRQQKYYAKIEFRNPENFIGIEGQYGTIFIGFYEWLTSPKYKTLRIFKAPVAYLLSDKKLYTFKPPEEIIKILLK